jgi:chemotaxis regulatin CheY-phosphate phosphatase CheZ
MKPSPRNNRSYTPLSPEEKKKREEENERLMKKWQEEMEEEMEAEKRERERVAGILKFLEIPHTNLMVVGEELVKILMDEKKVQAILTKVRNKAFW